jgi:hypothetical protein
VRLDSDTEEPIDRNTIARFLGALFGPVDWEAGQSIALRGLGEKGTLAEGLFREQQWADWSPPDGGAGAIATHAERWRGVNGGAFLIPGVMRPESLENRRQTEADVAWLTSVVVDLDNPDTAEDSLLRLEHALGPAGIVVESSPGKLHAYWLLDEPEDPARVARLRHLLALKVGGDPSFQRIPQVIRIPGTDHQKNGGRFRVWMRHCDPDCRHSISGIEERIQDLHPLPWASDQALAMAAQGTLTLSGLEAGNWTARERLTQDVHAGGQGAATRWDAFSQVAGHHIHSVRVGAIATPDEAKNLVRGWMLTHMIPPWPDERFDQEWGALVRLDVERNGALVAPEKLWGSGKVASHQEQGVIAWAVNRWVSRDPPPPRKWLVKGLIRAGATHVLASAGGVGKTFALLDLCLGIACPQGSLDGWLGQPIDPAHTGGTAVLMTAEDDVDELRIRIHDMDQQGRRFMGADKCVVIPLSQAGGVFPLVEMVQGAAKPSAAWREAMDTLAEIPDLQFVAIDTLSATLHGEENSSVVIQQYMAALNLLRDRVPGLAALVTHHVRKSGTRDAPIQTASDMRQAIRGSNALESSARMVMGIWQPADYAKQLQRLGLPVKTNTLFHMAVVKGNNPEAMQGERVLLRAPWGGLMDYTSRAVDNTPEGKQNAWLLWCIEQAATLGMPFTKTGKATSTYDRQSSLPPDIEAIGGRDKQHARIEELIRAGKIVQVQITGKGSGDWLDVPGGTLTQLTDMDKWQPRQGVFDLNWQAYQFVNTNGQILPI